MQTGVPNGCTDLHIFLQVPTNEIRASTDFGASIVVLKSWHAVDMHIL